MAVQLLILCSNCDFRLFKFSYSRFGATLRVCVWLESASTNQIIAQFPRNTFWDHLKGYLWIICHIESSLKKITNFATQQDQRNMTCNPSKLRFSDFLKVLPKVSLLIELWFDYDVKKWFWNQKEKAIYMYMQSLQSHFKSFSTKTSFLYR